MLSPSSLLLLFFSCCGAFRPSILSCQSSRRRAPFHSCAIFFLLRPLPLVPSAVLRPLLCLSTMPVNLRQLIQPAAPRSPSPATHVVHPELNPLQFGTLQRPRRIDILVFLEEAQHPRFHLRFMRGGGVVVVVSIIVDCCGCTIISLDAAEIQYPGNANRRDKSSSYRRVRSSS